jgi:hypothetical protein
LASNSTVAESNSIVMASKLIVTESISRVTESISIVTESKPLSKQVNIYMETVDHDGDEFTLIFPSQFE